MDKGLNTGRIDEFAKKPIKVDLKDKKILSLLSEDSRMPLSRIAKRIRLSREVVNYRIQRLLRKGVIKKFIPIINMERFGYGTFHVFFNINILNEERKNMLLNRLIEHPNTKSVMEYHDTWDLEWVLIAKTPQEFDWLLTELTKEFRGIIMQNDKLMLVRGYKSIQLPGEIYFEAGHKFQRLKRKSKESKIDEKDIGILSLLSEDSRLSSYVIGDKVGLSADAVNYRIKKMLDNETIFRFTILTNLSLLNYHWYTLCLNLKTFDLNSEMRFRELISGNPSVLRAVKVLGDRDLLIYVTTESSKQLHLVFKHIQQNFMNIIYNHQIWLAYKEHVFSSFPKVLQSIFQMKSYKNTNLQS